MRTSFERPSCKVCGSPHTVRDGMIKGTQRWECRTCGRKFLDNDARPGMKTPFPQVQSAIRMYYGGMSLNTVCREIQQKHHNFPSVSTVYEWINRYSHQVQAEAINYHPEVGDTWVADEITVKISGKQIWVWDVIDTKTHFLLASQLSLNHNAKDPQTLIERAIEKAGKIPKIVVSDKLAMLIEEAKHGFETGNSDERRITFSVNKQPTFDSERVHDALQRRVNLMSDLKNIDKAVEFIGGWLIYYNYFRRQERLKGKTPADVANIEYPYDR
jgi:transposase-like protein